MEPVIMTAIASSVISTVSGFNTAQNQLTIQEGNNRAEFIRRKALIEFNESRKRAQNRNVMRSMNSQIDSLEFNRLNNSYAETVAKVEVQKKMMADKGRMDAVMASKGLLDARSTQAVNARLEAEYTQQLQRIDDEAMNNEINLIKSIKAVKGQAFSKMDNSLNITGSEKQTTINPLTAGLSAGINAFVSQGGVNSLVGSLMPSSSSSVSTGGVTNER